MSKTKILENLKLLHSAVLSQPESHFGLAQFKQEEPCGTLFCTAGLAATMPEFQAQGVELVGTPTPSLYGTKTWWQVLINGEPLWDVDEYIAPADDLFGDAAADNCFSERWESPYDEAVLAEWEDSRDVSDKQLALYRLERQIEAVENT